MNKSNLILLVEDDERLNTVNRRALEFAGYSVMAARNLSEARGHLKLHTPDVIILDVKLPDGNGFDFCREIRETIAAPILFLTSVRDYRDELEGYCAGGDDYLKKPFDLDLMLAKVASFLRRDGILGRVRPASSIIRGSLTLDVVANRAKLNDTDMQLSVKEFAVLRVLVESEGKALTKEYLYETVWGQPMNNDDTALKTAISRLRKKLEADGFSITVTRGEGYRFE